MLQGGSPGANEYVGDGPYMRDEPGVAHTRGTIGISTRGRDTGDAQIFVNLVDSPRLDHVYTVFAVVERGMDVADRRARGRRHDARRAGGRAAPVSIRSARLPRDLTPNRLIGGAGARAPGRGPPLLDLTESNPTRVGLDLSRRLAGAARLIRGRCRTRPSRSASHAGA